jgi:hypothetical protein
MGLLLLKRLNYRKLNIYLSAQQTYEKSRGTQKLLTGEEKQITAKFDNGWRDILLICSEAN